MPPSADVLEEIHRTTAYDLRPIFNEVSPGLIDAMTRNRPSLSFNRSLHEFELLRDYFPDSNFAPFGVSYMMTKRRLKRRHVDWNIDVYGVRFDEDFEICVWADHAFVAGWPSMDAFLKNEREGNDR